MLVTPTGRLEAVANRLDSVIYAVTLEHAALRLAQRRPEGPVRRGDPSTTALTLEFDSFRHRLAIAGAVADPWRSIPWQSDRGRAAGTP